MGEERVTWESFYGGAAWRAIHRHKQIVLGLLDLDIVHAVREVVRDRGFSAKAVVWATRRLGGVDPWHTGFIYAPKVLLRFGPTPNLWGVPEEGCPHRQASLRNQAASTSRSAAALHAAPAPPPRRARV